MDNRQHNTVEQTERDEAFFTLIKAVIQHCHGRPIKQRLNIGEINAVFGKIGLAGIIRC
jgi:hypothetical protein